MPFYLLSEIVAPVFELMAIATLLAGAAAGLVDWWHFALVSAAITLVNSVFNTGALLMVDLHAPVYRCAGSSGSCADAARARRLPPDHGVGAPEGDVAVPPQGPGLAQVRTERPGRRRHVTAGRRDRRTTTRCSSQSRSRRSLSRSWRAGGDAAEPRLWSATAAPRSRARRACSRSGSVARRAARWARRSSATAEPTRGPCCRRSPTVCSWSMTGSVLSVNNRLCELVEFEPEELLGTAGPLPVLAPGAPPRDRGLARARSASLACATPSSPSGAGTGIAFACTWRGEPSRPMGALLGT